MAVNYAAKYSDKVQERFVHASKTEMAVNTDVDFVGVDTVNLYTINTVALNDYKMTGTNRYGDPTELENTVQTLKMTQDKSFSFTIDRRNYTDTMMTMEAGKALRRQVDEVIIPTVDKYRLGKIVAGAGKTVTAPITNTNAYTSFIDAKTHLLDNAVPEAGLFAYVSSNFYKSIRTDDSFIKASDMAQDMLVRGQVGEVEGIPIIYVPGTYLPENVEFVITHKDATTAPQKLAEYKTHDNPPGINGWLVEGRIYYDAFVLDSKKPAIYVQKSA